MRFHTTFLSLACAALLMQPCLAAAPSDTAAATPDGAAEEASAHELLNHYKAFPRLTREPRAVSRRLAQLCRVLWPEEIAQDREQYGPHSLAWVHVYANEAAAAELARSRRPFPVGAVIVKEKLGEQQAVAGIGAMQKMPPGYDPEGGDWQYVYVDESGKLAQGRLENCRTCHMRAKERDHVYFRSEG